MDNHTEIASNTNEMIAHLYELRRRLMLVAAIFGALVCLCYFFAEPIYQFLVRPLDASFEINHARRLIFTNLTEPFFTYIKLAFFMAFILSFPFLAYHLYRFTAPGLYEREQSAFRPFVYGAPVLFLLGAALAYYMIIPLAFRFFISFEVADIPGSMPIELEQKVGEYLSLIMRLIIAFGLAFQLPLLVGLLYKAGMVKEETLQKNRRYVFLGLLIFSAIITPPDVISQIGLTLPLYGLYEITLYMIRYYALGQEDDTPFENDEDKNKDEDDSINEDADETEKD